MKLGPGRLFGFVYLTTWCAALAALAWFMSDLHRYLVIGIGLALLFLAPDLPTLKRLLAGSDDNPPQAPD